MYSINVQGWSIYIVDLMWGINIRTLVQFIDGRLWRLRYWIVLSCFNITLLKYGTLRSNAAHGRDRGKVSIIGDLAWCQDSSLSKVFFLCENLGGEVPHPKTKFLGGWFFSHIFFLACGGLGIFSLMLHFTLIKCCRQKTRKLWHFTWRNWKTDRKNAYIYVMLK